MHFEWKDVKTKKKGELKARVRAEFFNTESFVTISERLWNNAPDRKTYSYSIYYNIKVHDKTMHGLRALPPEIVTMDAAKAQAEMYLKRMIKERFKYISTSAEVLKQVLDHMENSNHSNYDFE